MSRHMHKSVHSTHADAGSAAHSPSNSAGPTPTIITDMGRDAACEGWRSQKRNISTSCCYLRLCRLNPPPRITSLSHSPHKGSSIAYLDAIVGSSSNPIGHLREDSQILLFGPFWTFLISRVYNSV